MRYNVGGMHKITGLIIIVIIFTSIGIVMFSSSGSPSESQDLSVAPQMEQQQQAGPPQPTESTTAATTDTQGASESARYERAIITTSKGTIIIQLYPDEAPQTVANFGNKASDGFYEGLTFHRIEDWVAQGGDPQGNGTGGGQMKTELNDLPFQEGSLGVARGGNIEVSNDAQFFITKQEADWLDGQYTNFGIVTDGMDVVNSLEIEDEIISVSVE